MILEFFEPVIESDVHLDHPHLRQASIISFLAVLRSLLLINGCGNLCDSPVRDKHRLLPAVEGSLAQ